MPNYKGEKKNLSEAKHIINRSRNYQALSLCVFLKCSRMFYARKVALIIYHCVIAHPHVHTHKRPPHLCIRKLLSVVEQRQAVI